MAISPTDIRELHRAARESAERDLESLETSMANPDWVQGVVSRLGRYIDFGLTTEAYELADSLSEAAPPDGDPSPDRAVARCFLAHMDLSRSRKAAEHCACLGMWLSHSDPRVRGHANYAFGIQAAQSGAFCDARQFFDQARLAFLAAVDAVYVAKVDVSEIMVLRLEDRHDEAIAACEAAIAAAIAKLLKRQALLVNPHMA